MSTNGALLSGVHSSAGIFSHNNSHQNGIHSSSSKLNTQQQQQQQQITNSLFIRKEIQRFESVHPNIYSVYDLIDSINDFNLQQQIREHVVNIEGKK